MRFNFLLVAAAASVLGIGQMASAEVILQHVGANDPLTEGFTTASSTNLVTAPAGVTDPYDGVTEAWKMVDADVAASGGRNYTYRNVISGSQEADILANGMRATMNLRVEDTSDADTFPTHHIRMYVNGIGSYWVGFVATETGAQVVFPLSSDEENDDPINVAGDGYHEYVLTWDASTELATLSIDGLDVGEVAPSIVAASTTQFDWGANSSGGTGTAYYNEVTVESIPVPEPTSLALMGLGGLMMLRRRRQQA